MGFFDKLFGGGGNDGASEEEQSPEVKPKVDEEPIGERIDPPESYWATVLFSFPMEFEPGDVESLFERADLGLEEVEGGAGGVFRASGTGHTFVIEQKDEPFPRGETDREMLPEGFPDDYAYAGIAPQTELSAGREAADPWDEEGLLRVTTKLVRQLLFEDGLAVVLNGAGGRVVPAEQFLQMTAEIDEPDQRPFYGWIDMSYDEEREFLQTEGLGLLGLPELSVRLEGEDEQWRVKREQEALYFAASQMVHQNGPLGPLPIEEFRVPLGLEVGGGLIELDEEAEYTAYAVDQQEGRLVLASTGPGSVWTTWEGIEEEGAEIAIGSYQPFFRHECQRSLGAQLVGTMEADEIEEMPSMRYEAFQGESAQSALIVSNGLGRRARPADESGERFHRLELAVETPQASRAVLDILSAMATGIELSDDDCDPPDTLEFDVSLHGLQYFALSPMLPVEPEVGPAIELWRLVPLTDEEFGAIEGGEIGEWLEERDYASGAEYTERWMAAGG